MRRGSRGVRRGLLTPEKSPRVCRSLGSAVAAGLFRRRHQDRPRRRLGNLDGGPLRAVVAAWGDSARSGIFGERTSRDNLSDGSDL